jgi:hypothetical protein
VGSSAMALGHARHKSWAKSRDGGHDRWPNGDFTSFLLGKTPKTARLLFASLGKVMFEISSGSWSTEYGWSIAFVGTSGGIRL